VSNILLTLQNINKMKNIKTIIILFLFITIQQKLFAQLPTAGSYITNNTMGAFHGTWQWVNGIDTVKIFLATKKIFYPINGGYYMDDLVGWHIYKNGNTIIESSYNSINNVDNRTILGDNFNSLNVAECFFKDITKNKDGELTLSLNAAQNQLTWRLTEHKGMRVYGNGHTAPPSGLTLLRNMVLTKL